MKSLAHLLQNHRGQNEREHGDVLRMLEFERTLQKPFSRLQWPAHFTGSAVIVDTHEKSICLLFHKKLKKWLQPGGHCEEIDGGDLVATALREAREETGLNVVLYTGAPMPLDVDIHVIPARADEPQHEHLDVRILLKATSHSLTQDLLESEQLAWFSFEDALAMCPDEPMRRMILKAQQICRQSAEKSESQS